MASQDVTLNDNKKPSLKSLSHTMCVRETGEKERAEREREVLASMS